MRHKEFKFKKFKSRSIYETWNNRNVKTGLVSYIYKMPKSSINERDLYYFSISSVKSKLYDIKYSSLEDGKTYFSFVEVVDAVTNWWYRNI